MQLKTFRRLAPLEDGKIPNVYVDKWDAQWVYTESNLALLRALSLHASQDSAVPLLGIKLHEEPHKGSKGKRMTMIGNNPGACH